MHTRNNSKNVYRKAIISKKVKLRSESNSIFGQNDFEYWSKKLLAGLAYGCVLDVCCGTGNQLVLYAALPNVTTIFGVDISMESLTKSEERLADLKSDKRIILIESEMESMFEHEKLLGHRFGLISCFYGLYYSKNLASTIAEMIEHLYPDGTILIVGPYGNNNASFFSLLEKYFTLPELVIRSSSIFMEKDVLSVLKKKCEVKQEYFTNTIVYPNAQALINYWKASTFYFPQYEKEILTELNGHFANHNDFVMEKHVMAILARRVK